MRINKYFLILSSILLTITACNKNPFKFDVSHININVEINRFDLSIDSLRTHYSDDILKRLKTNHYDFLELYSELIIRVASPQNNDYMKNLNNFFEYPIYTEIVNSVNSTFQNIDWINKDIETALKYYKHYFPHFQAPQIYTFIGGFNHSIAIDSSVAGIGLDKYLGANSPFYSQLGVEKYLAATMTPEQIPVDFMRGILESESEYTFSEEHLLAKMIHEGRLLYLLRATLVDYEESRLMGYNEQQMKFCYSSESQMWNYLIEKKLLFNSEHMNVIRFTGKAPFTAPFSQESPGRIGIWLGYRIVSAYMKNNKDVSISELMQEDDFQKIMNKSKYRP